MTSTMHKAGRWLILALGVAATGCAPVPQSSGTWNGRVISRTLQTDPRRQNVKMYQAASLEIASGPDITSNSYHGWLPSPILVDEEERIIDPAVFGSSGVIHVEGIASRLWGANDPQGLPLYYVPASRDIMWVNGVIKVQRAVDSDGHAIRLNLVAHSLPPTTQSAELHWPDTTASEKQTP